MRIGFRQVLFQLHWFFGITAGLVLSIMGVTGALMSFEDEILQLVDPAPLSVPERDAPRLEPGELIRRIELAEGQRVVYMAAHASMHRSARVRFEGASEHQVDWYYDPYTADALGFQKGRAFFDSVEDLHRYLLAGERGKVVTGVAVMALVFFCLSGLYLRWPRRPLDWRNWFRLDTSLRGRSLYWALHSIVATWCLPIYLLIALTGLYWSQDWYREGLVRLLSESPPAARAARAAPSPEQGKLTAPPVDHSAVWRAVREQSGGHIGSFFMRLPDAPGRPVLVGYVAREVVGSRIFRSNQLQIDATSGRVLRHTLFADRSAGEKVLSNVLALHMGAFFGLPGRLLVTAAALCMPLFFVTGWLLYLDRRRKKRELRDARGGVSAAAGTSQGWLVGFASQSGVAERLAWQSAGQLQAAGWPVRVEPLASIDADRLRGVRNALFVVSTFGDGEPPDSARGFARRVLNLDLQLPELKYGLLALGNRQYGSFCGFARRLGIWLEKQGAGALFAPVEVDNADPRELDRWQQQLARLTGVAASRFESPDFRPWTLVERRLLNPGSLGAPTYLIALHPPAGASWLAGDVLEVRPRAVVDGGVAQLVREYSIASVPEDGRLELVVRQVRHVDGKLGIGSGWLTEYVPVGEGIEVRLRQNTGFHVPTDGRNLILIGNGTGLAGLRSLLKARERQGHGGNWLVFGERSIASDYYFRDEIEAWLESGHLARVDLAFSRDQAERIYVQQRLSDAAAELRDRVLGGGAAIYVCGSLEGMADGVDRVLRDVLGAEVVGALIEAGRYRRDIY